jgi:hypothetical protein
MFTSPFFDNITLLLAGWGAILSTIDLQKKD